MFCERCRPECLLGGRCFARTNLQENKHELTNDRALVFRYGSFILYTLSVHAHAFSKTVPHGWYDKYNIYIGKLRGQISARHLLVVFLKKKKINKNYKRYH